MVFSTCRTQRHYGMWNVKLAVLRHTCLSLRHTVCACSWSSFLHRSDNHHGYSQRPACESCLLRRCLLVFASLPTHTSSSCDTASPAPPPTVMVSSKFLDRLMQKLVVPWAMGAGPPSGCAPRDVSTLDVSIVFSVSVRRISIEATEPTPPSKLLTHARITKCSTKHPPLPHAWCCPENVSTSAPQTPRKDTLAGSP